MSADLRDHAPAHSAPRPRGEFVLYWLQTTHRAHDNFAFDFAVEKADALGISAEKKFDVRQYLREKREARTE